MGIYWEPGIRSEARPSLRSAVTEVLLTVLSSGLFLQSAIRCFCAVLTMEPEGFEQTFLHAMLLFLPLVITARGICEALPRYRFRLKLCVCLLYLLGIGFGLWRQRSMISYGGAAIAAKYIQQINFYYKTNLVFSSAAVDGLWELPAAQTLVISLFLVFAVLVCLSGRRILMGFLPLIFLSLLLLVGHSPDFAAAAFSFAGVILSSGRSWDRFEATDCVPQKEGAGRWTEPVLILLLLVTAAVIPLGCRALLSGQARLLAGRSVQLKQLQKGLEDWIESYTSVFTRENFESVNNRTPHYREREMLRYTVRDGRGEDWFASLLADEDRSWWFWEDVETILSQSAPAEGSSGKEDADGGDGAGAQQRDAGGVDGSGELLQDADGVDGSGAQQRDADGVDGSGALQRDADGGDGSVAQQRDAGGVDGSAAPLWDADGRLVRSMENAMRIYELGFGNEELSESLDLYEPEGNLYLRGFYGTDYVGGSWTDDSEVFSEACRKAGYREDELSALVVQSGKQAMDAKDMNLTYDLRFIDSTVEYTGLHSRTAYLPYNLIYREGEDIPPFAGDAGLVKDLGQRTIHARGWEGAAYSLESFGSSLYPWSSTLYWGIWSELSTPCGGVAGEQMGWYNRYVSENFLGVPDAKVPSVEKIADRLRTEELDELIARMELDSTLPSDSAYDTDLLVNAARIDYADHVAGYLHKLFYSTELDRIEDGTDAVEYFLSESGEGYCIHFASAGTLLLRKLGVPARFASGYVVRPEKFQRNGDGSYSASVLDSDAHAWVEVYLNNIGWVPVEMTPAASSEESLAAHRQRRQEQHRTTGQDRPQGAQLPTEQQTPATENTTADSQEGVQGSETQKEDGKAPAGGSGTGGTGGRGGTAHSVDSEEFMSRVFLPSLACVLLLVLALRLLSFRRRRGYQRLLSELRRNHNRNEVRRVNHLIYRRLCRQRHLFRRGLTDREYGELLRETYPGIEPDTWGRYMEVVKKASFSQGGIEQEEAALCNWIFRKVMIRR